MLALNRALHQAVLQLHAGNRREASQVMKCLRPRYDPGRDVRQPNVQDLTGADCIIQGSLDLCHGGSEVPQMHKIKVEIIKDEALRSEEHTSDLQSLMRIWYAVFCLIKNTTT